VVVGVAQHAAGQRAGVFAVLHQYLAVDHGRHDALGRLLDALVAGREVVQYFEGQRLHRVRVEDHNVGGHPGAPIVGGHCRFGEATFAVKRGNDGSAPIAAIRARAIQPRKTALRVSRKQKPPAC